MSVEQQHPIIAAAYKYADEYATKTGDDSADEKNWGLLMEDYLVASTPGLIQLLAEAEKQPEVPSSFEIEQVEITLAQIIATLRFHATYVKDMLVHRGYATQTDVEYYFAMANRTLEKSQNQEQLIIPVPMIGIVGQIASGKGTVGTIISNHTNSQHYPLSNRLREVSLGLGGSMEFPRHQLRAVNDALKPAYGSDVFVRWTIDQAQKRARLFGHKLVSLDGFRSLEEAQKFREKGGLLIGLQASQEVRFKRLVERNRPGDDDWEKFLESDAIESTWIKPIFANCDYIIDNNGTTETLEMQIVSILSQSFDQ